jgi:hypothetical protein
VNRSRWLLTFAFALIAVAVLAARPSPTPGPFLRDFEAYWGAGTTWNAHADPYGREIWNAERTVGGVDVSRDEILPFVGPPAALLVWSALAHLPYDAAARLWWAFLALGTLALAAVAVRASTLRVAPSLFLAAVALAAAFGPVTSDLALGQVAVLSFLGASIVALRSRQIATTGLAPSAVAAFVAFFQPNVALGLASQIGLNRTTTAMALGGVGTYAAGTLFLGWDWPTQYARTLFSHESVERFSAIQLTPAAIAHGAGASSVAAALVAALTAIAAIAVAILLWQQIADPFARFAAFAPLAPFVATFFHEHDLVVAYVAAAWCAVRATGPARGLALAGTLLVAIDWLGLAQRPSGIAQSALLASAAVCAFTALGPANGWRAVAAAVWPVAAIFLLAAWSAASHPAPVWPDALGPFHAASAASLPNVWHQEQLRTGLLAVNPGWSLLRALSLMGCALLSLSVFLCETSRRASANR